MGYDMDGLGQESRNPIANALALPLSCTKPSIWSEENNAQQTHVQYCIQYDINKVAHKVRFWTHKR